MTDNNNKWIKKKRWPWVIGGILLLIGLWQLFTNLYGEEEKELRRQLRETVKEKFPEETAEFLMVLARREAKERKITPSVPTLKRGNMGDAQIRVLSGLPGISTMLAGRLLSNFGSLERIFSAEEEELVKVDGIGRRKAREIRAVLSGSDEDGPAK